MNLLEINAKRKLGDLKEAAEILGITQFNASRAISRINSKHHIKLLNTLIIIINNRDKTKLKLKTFA